MCRCPILLKKYLWCLPFTLNYWLKECVKHMHNFESKHFHQKNKVRWCSQITLHTKRSFLLCYLHIHSRLVVFLNSKFDNFVCERNLIHEKLLHPKNKWGFPMQYLESAAWVLRLFGTDFFPGIEVGLSVLKSIFFPREENSGERTSRVFNFGIFIKYWGNTHLRLFTLHSLRL